MTTEPLVRGSRRESVPLVYSSEVARRQAFQVMPGVVLERAVAREIVRGNVIGGNRTGRVLGEGWIAHVQRTEGRLRPRPRAWLVIRVEATP